MGSELVGSLPTKLDKAIMAKAFWEAYPAYLNMGMSYDEYWNGDAESCVAYRKANKERLKEKDIMLWRQGLYNYHALCCAAPLFSLKPQKPTDYISPFGFGEKKKEEPKEDDAALAHVHAWADRVNSMRANNNGK